MDDDILKASGAFETVERLERLLKGRVDGYEVFFSVERGVGAEAREGRVEALKARSGSGVGLRTISGRRQGFAFSSVVTEEALREMADRAVSGSAEASVDEFLAFAEGPAEAQPPGDLGVFDAAYGGYGAEGCIERAIEIERSALGSDARVRRVRKASFQQSLHATLVANSNGVRVGQAATYFTASVTAVAEENGESQMGFDMETSHARDSIAPASVGVRAASNALRMLGGRRITTVRCPAVIENAVACELIEALSGSFLADNVLKGKSMLAGKTGVKVASSGVTVWDDGLKPGGWATSRRDGEGAPRAKTPLILDGVCQGYLYDTYWAGRCGARSTGNAARSSYRGMPAIGVSNLYMENGKAPLKALLSGMGSGIYVTELLGVHTINAVSGDFSLGAAGLWVEGSEFAYPLRGIALSGNLMELFLKVEGIADDIRFMGSIGSPSLLVGEMEVSGS
jgi:PmbA protein